MRVARAYFEQHYRDLEDAYLSSQDMIVLEALEPQKCRKQADEGPKGEENGTKGRVSSAATVQAAPCNGASALSEQPLGAQPCAPAQGSGQFSHNGAVPAQARPAGSGAASPPLHALRREVPQKLETADSCLLEPATSGGLALPRALSRNTTGIAAEGPESSALHGRIAKPLLAVQVRRDEPAN